ncbi:hypothetical protein LCGC14_1141900 [marine sediment metagenome]|uniref:Uncharacterized protein n=1 Tax=marine sediment metagenome TaxID=412755 RepID=A0A0F9Q3R9_9ZZZZ
MTEVGAKKQVAPTGDGVEITPLVIKDLEDRRRAGIARYGTPLKAHNGRSALIDAYQEALDMCIYLRQELTEQGWGDENIAEHDWKPEEEGLVPHTNERE